MTISGLCHPWWYSWMIDISIAAAFFLNTNDPVDIPLTICTFLHIFILPVMSFFM